MRSGVSKRWGIHGEESLFVLDWVHGEGAHRFPSARLSWSALTGGVARTSFRHATKGQAVSTPFSASLALALAFWCQMAGAALVMAMATTPARFFPVPPLPRQAGSAALLWFRLRRGFSV